MVSTHLSTTDTDFVVIYLIKHSGLIKWTYVVSLMDSSNNAITMGAAMALAIPIFMLFPCNMRLIYLETLLYMSL